MLGSDGVGGGSGGAAGWGGVPSPPAAPPKNHGPGQHRRRPHGQPRTRGDPRENTRNSSFFRRRRRCLKNRIIHHHNNNNNNNFWFRSCAGGRREPRDTRGTNTPVPPPRLGCPGARCSSSERFWGKKKKTNKMISGTARIYFGWLLVRGGCCPASTAPCSRLGRAAARLCPPPPAPHKRGAAPRWLCPLPGGGERCILGRSSCSSAPSPRGASLPLQAAGSGKLFTRRVGVPRCPPFIPGVGSGAGGGSPGPGAGGEGDKQARGLIAVIITIIMAFIWLPNESDHRQREKLSIAQALMNFFANCNQARPSQLAD